MPARPARAIDLAVSYTTKLKLDLALQYVLPGASQKDMTFAFLTYLTTSVGLCLVSTLMVNFGEPAAAGRLRGAGCSPQRVLNDRSPVLYTHFSMLRAALADTVVGSAAEALDQ